MQLITWLTAQRGRAKALAGHLKVSNATVSEWAHGKKPVPVDRCTPIEHYTEGEVTRPSLREDWRAHWPELIPPPVVDRRDPNRPSPYAGSDIDRRTTVGEG